RRARSSACGAGAYPTSGAEAAATSWCRWWSTPPSTSPLRRRRRSDASPPNAARRWHRPRRASSPRSSPRSAEPPRARLPAARPPPRQARSPHLGGRGAGGVTADGSRLTIAWTGGPLVFVDDLEHPELTVDDHHHLGRVRRLRRGDPVVIGDGRGSWRSGSFADRVPQDLGPVHTAPPPAPAVGVGFALVKGQKPELVVQKLTELGVDRIVPFVAARSVVRWDDAK